MKLGLDSYSYHLAFGAHADFRPRRPLTLLGFIERVARLGLDGFQIDPLHLESRARTYLDEVRAAAAARGLFVEYGTLGLEPRRLRRELQVAARLGSPVLRTFGHFDRHHPRTRVAEVWRRGVAALREVAPVARDLGIRLAVENHGDFTTAELVRLVEAVDSPAVGICLDVGNPLLTLEEPLVAIRAMLPHVVTTHFKDYAMRPTHAGAKIVGVALGEGIIDLPAAVKLLRSAPALDRIILEIPIEAQADEAAALAHEDRCVRRSVRHVRGRLGLRPR
jgi:3-oxoisoapionate decarboxylase